VVGTRDRHRHRGRVVVGIRVGMHLGGRHRDMGRFRIGVRVRGRCKIEVRGRDRYRIEGLRPGRQISRTCTCFYGGVTISYVHGQAVKSKHHHRQ
jgi:hypothetical protein